MTAFAADALGAVRACAPPWVTDPESLSSWSAANPSFSHSFEDPLTGLVARGGMDASTTSLLLGAGAPPPSSSSQESSYTLSFPASSPLASTTSAVGPSTTSGQAGILVNSRSVIIILGLGMVVMFISQVL